MPLINAGPIMYLLRGFRVGYIGGRYAGGKTALAYRLAYELLEHHGFRYVLSNCEDVWSDDPAGVVCRPNARGTPILMDAVIILDEAGLVIEGASQAKRFNAFLRKFNVILLLPSA